MQLHFDSYKLHNLVLKALVKKDSLCSNQLILHPPPILTSQAYFFHYKWLLHFQEAESTFSLFHMAAVATA